MKSILFIDDDQFVTALYRTKLQSEGFSMDIAHSGAEALAKLEKNRPDIIILDLNMPGITGVEVLKLIRANLRLQHIPVIIFSNGYVRSLTEEASKLGIQKIFVKAQCPPKILITEIKELLSRDIKPVSDLVIDTADMPEITAAETPALISLFASSEDPDTLRDLLKKTYKATSRIITEAAKSAETTLEGKLGRALEKLFEDLYAHPEHITASTKQTLTTALQKLLQIESEKANKALDSEQALKDLLKTLE